MFQQVQLIGRLGANPEIKEIKSGLSVCNFTVAVTETWFDSNKQKQESTEWFRCQIWGAGAETFCKFTEKGSLVFLQGKMKTRSWEGKDGNKKYQTELNVNSFKFLSKKDPEQSSLSFEDDSEIAF